MHNCTRSTICMYTETGFPFFFSFFSIQFSSETFRRESKFYIGHIHCAFVASLSNCRSKFFAPPRYTLVWRKSTFFRITRIPESLAPLVVYEYFRYTRCVIKLVRVRVVYTYITPGAAIDISIHIWCCGQCRKVFTVARSKLLRKLVSKFVNTFYSFVYFILLVLLLLLFCTFRVLVSGSWHSVDTDLLGCSRS